MDQLTPRPVLSVLHDDNEWRQSDNHRNRRFGDLLRRAGDFDRFCWLYPQHRNITLLRIEMLDPEQRRLLEINHGCPGITQHLRWIPDGSTILTGGLRLIFGLASWPKSVRVETPCATP